MAARQRAKTDVPALGTPKKKKKKKKTGPGASREGQRR
jgi:hypothetical protein